MYLSTYSDNTFFSAFLTKRYNSQWTVMLCCMNLCEKYRLQPTTCEMYHSLINSKYFLPFQQWRPWRHVEVYWRSGSSWHTRLRHQQLVHWWSRIWFHLTHNGHLWTRAKPRLPFNHTPRAHKTLYHFESVKLISYNSSSQCHIASVLYHIPQIKETVISNKWSQ